MWVEGGDKHQALVKELADVRFICLDAQHHVLSERG